MAERKQITTKDAEGNATFLASDFEAAMEKWIKEVASNSEPKDAHANIGWFSGGATRAHEWHKSHPSEDELSQVLDECDLSQRHTMPTSMKLVIGTKFVPHRGEFEARKQCIRQIRKRKDEYYYVSGFGKTRLEAAKNLLMKLREVKR